MKNKTKKIYYTKEDYNSDNGLQVSVWGPCIWTFLHTISFNYKLNPTQEDKKNYRDFILSLQHILPCGKCRENLKRNFKKLPLKDEHLENRETFSRYIYTLHETVNTMLKKKSGLTYEEVRDRFENFRARCSKLSSSASHTKKKTHKGCSEPITGHIKSKCILKIVPKTKKCNTLNISQKCLAKNSRRHRNGTP
jgi:hypothetical protein